MQSQGPISTARLQNPGIGCRAESLEFRDTKCRPSCKFEGSWFGEFQGVSGVSVGHSCCTLECYFMPRHPTTASQLVFSKAIGQSSRERHSWPSWLLRV